MKAMAIGTLILLVSGWTVAIIVMVNSYINSKRLSDAIDEFDDDLENESNEIAITKPREFGENDDDHVLFEHI